MNANYFSCLRSAGLVAGTLLLLGAARAADADAFPAFTDNYIKVSAVGSSYNEGSKAASQRRTQLPSMGAAGIEAFSYNKEVSKTTNWQVDGKALAGAEDYLAKFKIVKNEVGSFEAGYKTFRTFYDGVGGFFPLTNAWMPLYQRALYVDRGSFFVNGTVEIPKAPVFRFSYTNETRTGRKDSTILGETDFTNVPISSLAANNTISAVRKIAPAYLNLGERQQTLQGSVRQSFGATTATLSLIGTRINNLNSRTVDRYANEVKPFPAIPANPPVSVDPSQANNAQRGYDTQGVDEKGFTLLGKVEHVVNQNVTVYSGASFRHSSGDFTSDRMVNLSIMTATGLQQLPGGFTSGGRPPYSYTGDGTIKANVYTANVGALMKVSRDLVVDVGLKAEDYDAIAHSKVRYVNNLITPATGVNVFMPIDNTGSSRNSEKVWAPEVSFRYSGIKNVSFFGSWDLRSSPGDERSNYGSLSVNTTPGAPNPVTAGLALSSDKVNEKHQNWKLGVNWNPNPFFSTRAEFFSKDHENRFEGYGVSAGGFYILDYDIWGTRLSATIRPLPTISCTTRFTNQFGKAAVTDNLVAKGTSNDAKRYSISESISWVPAKTLYLQGDVNVVYDSISTSYPRVTGLARDALHNADNNYWNGSVLVGFVVDKMTNAQLQGTYYKANNVDYSLSTVSLPLGAGGREYTVTAGVTRKLSDRWMGSAKVGYFESRDELSGGTRNFHGPLAYVSIQHSL